MRARRPLLTDHEGTISEIWPAFTDVMSTMALILFVLVLLAYVRSLISSKQLDAYQHQIAASELQLRSLQDVLQRTSADVTASQQRLKEQEGVIANSNRELDLLRAQLQGIAVLRVAVLDKLKQAIEAELGGGGNGAALVSVGDNGNLVINESLVFEYGSYAIKKDAKPVLDSLARVLGKLLADDSVRNNIDTILIQGHTDERGSSSYNWDLSARRATAVLDYMFESNRALSDAYGSYFAASAYSQFRPINPAKTEAAYRQNRRIEIAVVPKDANIRKVIDEYMTGPAGPASPATSP
ncbi:MAG TPA: OmpA family protein [Polyangia bacterium]|jgi:chemotaxis protein MotB|nr:OmpA family protein [Polyangia bacterium]